MSTGNEGRTPATDGEALGRGTILARILLALGIGVAGGTIFNWLTMPLPWMLGPMTFNTVAAVMRVPILPPIRVRPYMIVVIGVMLGSGFTPDIIGHAAAWGLSLIFLAAYLAVSGALVVPYYRRVGGFDTVTSYFAGMPGGLNEMVFIGRDMGGDDRAIALAHVSRVVLVVGVVAVWFRLIAGYDLGDRSEFGIPFAEIPWSDLALLAAAGGVGFLAGRWLKLPSPTLIGPMLASAAIHLTGLSHNPPPREFVIVAQIFTGTVIGCRFIGSTPREIGRAIVLSLGATMIMMAVTLIFAVSLHGLFGQPLEQVLLAYSPGGLAEMSLVAMAMNAEVAYVASHHMVRITLVIMIAPVVFSALRRRAGTGRDAGGGDGG